MVRRNAVTSVALAVAVVAGAARPSAAQVKLETKYPEGTTSRYRTTSKTHQILTIAGMDVMTEADQTLVSSYSVGKANADGTVPVSSKLESIKTEIGLPGGVSFRFDSADPDAKVDDPQLAFLTDVYKILLGLTYTVVLDAKGNPRHVEGTEPHLAKLDGLDPKVAAVLKGRLQADSIKREFATAHAAMPDILVRRGEPWERTEASDLGGGQVMTFKKRYEYLGTVDEGGRTLDKIGVKAVEVTYAMDPAAESPLKHEKSDLKIDSSDGVILFDREAGRPVKTTGKTRIVGDLTFKAGETELPSKLDLTFDTTSVLEPSAE